MTKTNTVTKFTLIATLYVSQAIPLGFFIVAIPAILRWQGLSLRGVGMLSAIAFPWLIKFLWAPLVDRYGSARFGHFRSWLLPLQALSVLTVVGIAFLDLENQFTPLVLAGALFMLLAATQDVATDGLSVRVLTHDERGPGNGVQVGGYYIGQIVGGGLMLIAFHRFGWTLAVLTMAAFLALPLFPALFFREPAHPREARVRTVDYRALGRFFTRPGAGSWAVILLLYRTGETMAATMFNPMLVDLGLSLERIGLLLGVASSFGSFSGALLGGFLIRSLGRKLSLVTFGLVQAVAVSALALPAMGFFSNAVIYSVAIASAFAGGMATVALYTSMMDYCSAETSATDFTLQQSLAAVGPLLASSLSGFIAGKLGYSLHFGICAGFAVLTVILVARCFVPAAAPRVAAEAA
ncbi:MAG TPA: MFS transporter [Thermoanaerobaculia bacterium]|nr:MFS transporter [Thermoanaerobaculia bacterium]